MHGRLHYCCYFLNDVILEGGEPEEAIVSCFPRMLAAVLLHCGCLVGSQFPIQSPVVSSELKKSTGSPVALAHTGIKTLLLRARTDMVILHLNDVGGWKDFEDPLHFHMAVMLQNPWGCTVQQL